MSLRVVLLAEGGGELIGETWGVPPAAGQPILPEGYGAGHHLVCRALVQARSIPESAVHFEVPPRVRGREARGSDLLRRETLRRLTSWPAAEARPQLIVLLVDRDGHRDRLAMLMNHLADNPTPHVVAVAIEEFEAWLAADTEALEVVMGDALGLPGPPETLAPGEAKSLLKGWCSERGDREHSRRLRTTLAQTCDLPTVATRCASFQAFLVELEKLGS